jgi:two-component system, NtrC family, sensor kinase
MAEQASILLIEDEARLRHNLQIILQGEGYRVVTAENGLEGMQKAQVEPFDLVLTDLVMPEVDGFQVMEYLRDHCPDTVVVAITAYASTGSTIEALRKGAYDYLAKPFDFELMQFVIQRALEKSRMQKAFRHYMSELERQVEERTSKLTESNKYLEKSLADLRAAEEQLIQTEKLRALGKLTAVVTHELNEPLTVIVGFAQLLTHMAPAGSKMKAYLEQISAAAFRCHQIVQSLFNFTWKQAPNKVYTDINELCEKTLRALAYQVDLSTIVVERQFDQTLPRTMADPHQLQQAFINIALNAYQAMMSGRGEGKLVVETKRGDGVIQIAFHDDGPGIPQEHQGRIFDPFFTTKENGAGLGLSLSHGMITEHGGKVSVHSIPGEGSTFRIELPILEPWRAMRQSVAENTSAVDGRRVLVVDDDEKSLSLLQDIVRHLGHEVEGVFSAQEALERIATHKYDLLIADITMSHADDAHLYQQVQTLRPELAQRTIFTSAELIRDDALAFLEQTSHRFVPKPFSIAELEGSIRQTLRPQVDDSREDDA